MLFLAVFCGFLAEYQLEHKIEKERARQLAKNLYAEVYADSIAIQQVLELRLIKEKYCIDFATYIRDSSLTKFSENFYRSFAGLFYRNAFNLGLLLLQSADGERLLGAHDVVFDPGSGQISFDTSPATMRQTISCEPVPDFLLEYVALGGLLPYLKARRSAANQLAVNTRKM